MKTIKVYHGTNQYFEQFDQGKARLVNDYYGGGVAYFTTDIGVAKTYADNMFKSKGGERYVFEVSLRIDKLFDVNHIFPQEELAKLIKSNKEAEDFARGAGLLKAGADRISVITQLQMNSIKLSSDEVFKGLSRGMNETAKAREKIKRLKYDTLRYNGGANMGAKPHDVYITYYADRAKITKRYMYDAQGNRFEAR